ncbi:MAG TPA: hypothetical protein VK814_12055 [Acidobacteriaceae bacterium]|jgi:hypothetical protein|nr:hypothetical protein [Acidobacteriaceae bacterium]
MTKREFLDQLGLSSEEFRDLMQKFVYFLEPLNEAQRDAVRRSMPTIAEAASSLGPDLTQDQLGEILIGILEGIDFVVLGCHSFKTMNINPGSSIAPHQHKPEKPK